MACGATPTSTSPSSFGSTTLLPDGRYLLAVNSLPGRAGCAPAWPPDVAAARAAIVVLRREGDEWVARAEQSPGDDGLELRLYSIGGTRIAGVVRGAFATSVAPGPAGIDDAGPGVSFGPRTAGGRFVSGDLPFGSSGHGRVEGPTTFLDRERDPMVCPEAEWAITPALL